MYNYNYFQSILFITHVDPKTTEIKLEPKEVAKAAKWTAEQNHREGAKQIKMGVVAKDQWWAPGYNKKVAIKLNKKERDTKERDRSNEI